MDCRRVLGRLSMLLSIHRGEKVEKIGGPCFNHRKLNDGQLIVNSLMNCECGRDGEKVKNHNFIRVFSSFHCPGSSWSFARRRLHHSWVCLTSETKLQNFSTLQVFFCKDIIYYSILWKRTTKLQLVLKVSYFRNVLLVPSNLPKNQRKFSKKRLN